MTKLILGLITMLLVIACQTPNSNQVNNLADNDNCKVIKHDFGKTEICQPVQKVAVLGSYQLAQLLSLDYQPYAFSDVWGIKQSKYLNNLKETLPILGDLVDTKPLNLGTANNPSLEILSQIKPDLILGETRNRSQYQLLSQIAPTLLYKDRTMVGEWQKDLKSLAEALHATEKAEKVIDNYEENLAQAKADFRSLTSQNNKVLLLSGNRLDGQLFTLGEKTDLRHLFTQLGFEVITLTAEQNMGINTSISLEKIPELAKKADYIFILGYSSEVANKSPQEVLESQTADIQKQWYENPLTKTLPTTKNDQVYFVSFAIWNGFNSAIASDHILEELKQNLLN